jgi:hypothetical protein
LDAKKRKELSEWVTSFIKCEITPTVDEAVRKLYDVLADFNYLTYISEKRTDALRETLHAIINADDIKDNLDFPLREMAFKSLEIDTGLADQQYLRLEDHEALKAIRVSIQEATT